MQNQLILSVLSDDKPGVVRAVANVVGACDGSWQESHLSHLGGKFAGVISISIESDKRPMLERSLNKLIEQGVRVVVDELLDVAEADLVVAKFNAAAPDRNGIVLELSQAFAEQGINVMELATECTSMPYSGDPLFSATGLVQLPEGLTLDQAEGVMASASAELGMDFEFLSAE